LLILMWITFMTVRPDPVTNLASRFCEPFVNCDRDAVESMGEDEQVLCTESSRVAARQDHRWVSGNLSPPKRVAKASIDPS
jgi:hypothetical protein